MAFLYLQDEFYSFRWNYPHEYTCENQYCDHLETKCYSGFRPSEKLFFWRYWIVITLASIFISFVDLIETGCYIRKFSSKEVKKTIEYRDNSNFNRNLQNGRNRVFSNSSNLLSEPGVIGFEQALRSPSVPGNLGTFQTPPRTSQF